MLKAARRLSRRRCVMLKYLTIALLAITPAFSVFGATPAAEHSAAGHSPAIHSTHSARHLTAAQRKARLDRVEHRRAVRRIAARRIAKERQWKRRPVRSTVARRAVRHRAIRHRVARSSVARRHVVRHTTLARRTATHRAYERHLAHERWLRRHRAYEARLRREHAARHLAYERRVAAHRRAPARGEAVSDAAAGMELAKADVPVAPRALAGAASGAGLDYVSHAHVRLYWRSPLRGTHASLVRQNERDRADGLTRIETEHELQEMVREHSLIPLPLNAELQADPRLAQDRRYTRPWTAHFLRDLGRMYTHRFGDALVITSAVRPASYQQKLTWRNGNAAPANGAIASPHEFGATIDIGKKGMTAREMAWMRGYLLPLQQAGQIDVEEEFYQACFHITVYKNYVPAPVMRPQPEMADRQVDTEAR